jgi:hypothetical protein
LLVRFLEGYNDHLSCFPDPETSCEVEGVYDISWFIQLLASSGQSQGLFSYDGWGYKTRSRLAGATGYRDDKIQSADIIQMADETADTMSDAMSVVIRRLTEKSSSLL